VALSPWRTASLAALSLVRAAVSSTGADWRAPACSASRERRRRRHGPSFGSWWSKTTLHRVVDRGCFAAGGGAEVAWRCGKGATLEACLR
jgi:hypothetical protein